jgi:hypothetical protein
MRLYTPRLSYLFLYYFGCKGFCRVLIVLNDIFVLVSLNVFVICFDSCPKYVNVIHLQICIYAQILYLFFMNLKIHRMKILSYSTK